MVTTIRRMFDRLFDRNTVLQLARQTGAVVRLRDIHPADLVASMMCCALGDETRSIATARRLYGELTGFTPEESSFYERLQSGSSALLLELFGRAIAMCPRQPRRALARLLGRRIVDCLLVDATQTPLPARATARFPSTNEERGGLKLTLIHSLVEHRLFDLCVTEARRHDRSCLQLPDDLSRKLLVADRAYADHRLLREIEARGGYFVIRLSDSVPTIVDVRTGLGRRHIGARLEGPMPFHGLVDVDAVFPIYKLWAAFRVVGVPVERVLRDGRTEQHYIWLVTNLPEEEFDADTVATLYRLRWEIEVLFRVLKTVGRLDQLRSSSPAIIMSFLWATLLSLVLAQWLCAILRRENPRVEPSLFRVFWLLLGYLRGVASAERRRQRRPRLDEFVLALEREGRNPNPGRPYATARHLEARRCCY
jgi:hypothetical protein